MRYVQTRLHDEDFQKLKIVSLTTGIPVVKITRTAILQYLDKSLKEEQNGKSSEIRKED